MAEASLRQGVERNDDEIASVNSENSTIMASNTSKEKTRRSSRTTKKDIENIENTMNMRLEQHDKQFSSLDEKISLLLSLFENRAPRPEVTMTSETVSISDGTSTRQPLISVENSLNKDYGISDSQLPADDNVSLHVSRAERQHIGLSESDSEQGSVHTQNNDNLCDDRFSKYLSKEQTSNEKQNLCEKFGEDACTKSKNRTGIVLEKNQIDILKDSWRADDPSHITAFKENYRHMFPIDESCETHFNVPKMDDSVDALLVKRFGFKAAFGKTPALFSKTMKSVERLAFQGQMAARMGLITTCYTQQALGVLLDSLQQKEPNIDLAVQNVRDIFALSTKTLDQVARTGASHHLIRRRATMHDTGLSEFKNYTSSIMKLPLTSEGVLGSQFDKSLKEKKELNKQLSEVLPEISVSKRTSSNTNSSVKRKTNFTISDSSAKKPRTDFGGSYNNDKSWSSQYRIPRSNYYRNDNKNKNTVSSFRTGGAKQNQS